MKHLHCGRPTILEQCPPLPNGLAKGMLAPQQVSSAYLQPPESSNVKPARPKQPVCSGTHAHTRLFPCQRSQQHAARWPHVPWRAAV